MQKLPFGDRCLLCAHDPFLVCAVHPAGPEGDNCLDFRPDLDLENRFEDFLGLERQIGAEMEDDETLIEEQWQPEGARFVNGELIIERDNDSGASLREHRSFYNGEEIIQPQQRWTREEQLELLDYHPMFTGRCPQCERTFPRYDRPPVHSIRFG
jgi:hypothetical protein